MLKNKTIIIGITGCIAAYKSASLVSQLKKLGADVWVVMTKSSQHFVGPLTFKTLSGNPVATDLFDAETLNFPVPHISLTDRADLMVIAPATANIIAKTAQGLADDALSTMLLAAKCKKLFAPAMNTNMWDNKLTLDNVSKLKELGIEFIGPDSGKLACGDIGEGRMTEPEKILEKIVEMLIPKQDLKGKKILVTAGGTQEAIDPVRYIGNRSSGRMGYAIAEAARSRGADVKLISGPVTIGAPLDISPIHVESAEEMYKAVLEHFKYSDVLVMSAAVADFSAKNPSKGKIKKKSDMSLELKQNKDILAEIKKFKKKQKVIGFALETDNLLENAKKKLKEKGLDMIVLNGPETIGSADIKAGFVYPSGKIKDLPKLLKSQLADKILDAIRQLILPD